MVSSADVTGEYPVEKVAAEGRSSGSELPDAELRIGSARQTSTSE
jgi:hypothetical protein